MPRLVEDEIGCAGYPSITYPPASDDEEEVVVEQSSGRKRRAGE